MSIMEPHSKSQKTIHTIDELLSIQQFALEHIQEAIYLVDSDAHITYVNKAASTYLGYSKEELLSMRVYDLDPQFPSDIWQEHWHYLQEHKSSLIETKHRSKEGIFIPVEVNANYFEYNDVGYNMALVRDITERKEVETQLLEQNRFLESLLNTIPVPIFMKDKETRYKGFNKAFEEFYGKNKEELIGKGVFDIFPPDQAQVFFDADAELFRNGVTQIYEAQLQDARGVDHTVMFHKAIYCDEAGEAIGQIGTILDITDRKQAELQLQHTLEFNEGVIGAIPDLLFEFTPDGTYVGIWAQDETLLLEQRNMLLGKNFKELLPPDIVSTSLQAMKEVDEKGYSLGKTYSLDLPEGKHWFELSVSKKKTSGNYIALSRNITKRKAQEEQILIKEQEFRSLAENIPDNIARWDCKGGYLYINPVQERLLGVKHADVIGKRLSEAFPEIDFSVLDGAIAQVVETGEPIQFLRQLVPTVDGTMDIHNINLVPERDENGTIVSVLGVGRDMTNIYRLQDELTAKEEQFRTLVENLPDNIIRYNKECRAIYISPTMVRVYGDEAVSMLIDKTPIESDPSFSLPIKLYQNALKKVIATGEQEEITIDIPTSSAEMQVHQIRFFAERDQKGKICGALVIGSDITERKQQEELLYKTKAKLSAVISTIPDLIWVKDAEGVYMMCNSAFENFFGASCGEIIGKTDYDFISREQADFFRQKDLETMESGEMRINEEEIVFAHNDQHTLLETRKIPVYNGDEFMGILGIGRDITERKQMEIEITKQKDFQNTLLLSVAEAGLGVHVIEEGRYIYTNDLIKAKKYGYDEEFFKLKPNFLDTIHPDDRAKAYDMYKRRLAGEDVTNTYELNVMVADGTCREHSVSVIVIPNTDPIQTIVVTQDISERKESDKKIEFMAHHDALTGLPNRTLAKIRAEQIMANVRRLGTKAAFLFIDLDGFKAINDTLGHSVGDAMLKTIASRLKESIRESDMISRQGGDEFLLVLSDIQESNIIASTAEKILNELEKSFEIDSNTLSLSGSIGIALYPDHGETFETLLQSADTAMYKAKETGKNRYHFYTQQMSHNLIGQFKIQSDLKSALANNEFILYYQPQIDLATNSIIGVEALIRWNHPQLGMMPPMNFIPIAESSGLIVSIGQWVIEEACRQVALWQEMGIELCIAVNISAMQFKRGNLEEIVINALSTSKINPKYLELELTESIIMHDADNTLQSVRNLKELGVQLSIDDFGTGYSSLSYLKRFAVDKLKIDQSFVRDILQDKDDAAIVKTIIQMAKNLNLITIAEGVENQEVLSNIQKFGCDEVQGYHFAKPMSAYDFELYHTNFYGKKS